MYDFNLTYVSYLSSINLSMYVIIEYWDSIHEKFVMYDFNLTYVSYLQLSSLQNPSQNDRPKILESMLEGLSPNH